VVALFLDHFINFKDFAVFAWNWLSEDCSDDNDWCQGADLTFDTYVDFEDLAFFVECWLEEDTTVPEPDPSEWEIEPYSASTTSINMTAETSFDAWWGSDVQYYFESVTDDVNSGWLGSPTYTDTGLATGAEYGYRVRVRDGSEQIPDDGTGEPGNKTDWSVIRYAIAGEVGAAEPPSWETEPYATSPNSIEMVATTSDSNGIGYVEYYFDETSGNPGGSDSGWQNEPNYTDTGLDPNTTYTYRVRARDVNDKITDWSVPLDATTLAEGEDTTPPEPDPATWETEPYATSFTSILMVATTALDPSGVEYYFECTSNPLYSSNPDPDIYQDSPIYSVTGLPEGMYTFVVRVRDAYLNTTGDSDPPITVDLEPPTPTGGSPGDPMAWDETITPTGLPREIYGGGIPGVDIYATMTAVVATDPSGVEYRFICTTTPGFSSGWQSSPTYTILVGALGRAEAFYVIARDLSPIQNETGPSWPPVAAIPR